MTFLLPEGPGDPGDPLVLLDLCGLHVEHQEQNLHLGKDWT